MTDLPNQLDKLNHAHILAPGLYFHTMNGEFVCSMNGEWISGTAEYFNVQWSDDQSKFIITLKCSTKEHIIKGNHNEQKA